MARVPAAAATEPPADLRRRAANPVVRNTRPALRTSTGQFAILGVEIDAIPHRPSRSGCPRRKGCTDRARIGESPTGLLYLQHRTAHTLHSVPAAGVTTCTVE